MCFPRGSLYNTNVLYRNRQTHKHIIYGYPYGTTCEKVGCKPVVKAICTCGWREWVINTGRRYDRRRKRLVSDAEVDVEKSVLLIVLVKHSQTFRRAALCYTNLIRSPVLWTVDLMFCACFFFFFSPTHFFRRLQTEIFETFPHNVALLEKEALLCRFPKSAP